MSNLLMIQFLKWVSERPRTYEETMEAWRSSCPRLTVWEDALSDALIEIRTELNGSRVCLTSRGHSTIDQRELRIPDCEIQVSDRLSA